MRVLIVYDCLYPYTVGGAERWYRQLAERLAADGHEVTFATRRQWDRDQPPDVPGVRVVAVSPRSGLYTESGRRRIDQALVFGVGMLWHLIRHGRRYDVVHTASFPYFSLLAAAAVRRLGRYRLIVDWHEYWSWAYWREYLGPLGVVGWLVQRLCAHVRQKAFCFARLTASRLAPFHDDVVVLEGQWDGPVTTEAVRPADGSVVFAGRLIREKHAEALPPAVAWARRSAPELHCEVYGEGPARGEVAAAAEQLDGVRLHGFVDTDELDEALATALCLALPSRREGYGKVVIEAARFGTPSVVVAGEDNAAVELVEDGVNGTVAASPAPADLGAAILRIREGGDELRESTSRWFAAHADRLSLERSLRIVLEAYAA